MSALDPMALDDFKVAIRRLRIALAEKRPIAEICRLAFAVGAVRKKLEEHHAARCST